jgi:hypothetical protein
MMAVYQIPKKAGKFIVVVARGGHFAVWNRKNGKDEVSIPVRTVARGREICEILNRKGRPETIEISNAD